MEGLNLTYVNEFGIVNKTLIYLYQYLFYYIFIRSPGLEMTNTIYNKKIE